MTAGYYLVNYSVNATSTADGTLGVSMNINDVVFTNSETVEDTTNANLSSSYIINVADDTVLSFINSGTVPTTFSNFNVVIKKLTTN